MTGEILDRRANHVEPAALLREAAGGSTSGFGGLFLLPVLAFVAVGMLFFARRAEVT